MMITILEIISAILFFILSFLYWNRLTWEKTMNDYAISFFFSILYFVCSAFFIILSFNIL